MTRARLNWVAQISALACLVACGSSGNNSLGAGSSSSLSANMGGQGAALNVGGSGTTKNGGGANAAGVPNNGGANGNAGNGTSGNGTAGNGTSGANTQAGNSGTGSSGSTSDGGSGNGGAGNGGAGNGGAGNGGAGNGGANNGSLGGNAPGGGSSIDVKITGGTGNTVDVGTGGGGNTIDVGTGGGFTIDMGTGGGSTIDLGTGGGSTIDLGTGGGSTIDLGTGGGGTIDLGTGGGGTIDLGCAKTTLTNINLYVIKDATPSGADTEGNMYVGGNLVGGGGYSVGAKDVIDCSIYSLVVGGNVSGVVVKGGKAAAGGTITNSTNQDCGGITRGIPASVNFATLESQVENLSIMLSQLAPNCIVSRNASGALMLTGTDPVLNVCNIDASQLGNVNVNFPANSSVVVNVTGTSVTWSGSSVCLNGQCADSTQADYVVWNMFQATSINPSGIAIEGSLLAPLATLGGSGGHIAGQVIVKYLTGGLEYHPYYFQGCIKWPTQV